MLEVPVLVIDDELSYYVCMPNTIRALEHNLVLLVMEMFILVVMNKI